MSADKHENAATLDLLATCTASVVKAADERSLKRLLPRRMLKKVDDWATDHNMCRLDAIHELLARGLKVRSKATGRIRCAACAKEQIFPRIM